MVPSSIRFVATYGKPVVLLRSFVRSPSAFHAANTDTHTITVTDVVLLWIAPSGQRQAWTVDRSRPTLNAPGTQTKSVCGGHDDANAYAYVRGRRNHDDADYHRPPRSALH